MDNPEKLATQCTQDEEKNRKKPTTQQFLHCPLAYKKFEDIKGIIRRSNSKND
jgi:hypothetical protein